MCTVLLLALLACTPKGGDDSGAPTDGGATDGGGDAGTDGGSGDGGTGDGGTGDGTPYVGMAFHLDLEEATWTAPPALGDAFFGDSRPDLLLEVLAAYEGNIDLRHGWSDADFTAQELCVETTDLVAPTLGLPDLATEPATFPLTWRDVWYPLLDASITGRLPDATGDPLRDWTLQGVIDLRTWAPAFSPLIGTDDPEELATVFAGFGVEARACPSDGVALCVDLAVEGEEAPSWEESLTPRTADEVALDGSCG